MKQIQRRLTRRYLYCAALLLLASITGALAAPTDVVQSVTYNGETITMRMKRQDLRGSNFELWAHNSSGTYDVLTPVAERSYIGTVDEYPGAVSCGVLQDDGEFLGAVYFDRGVLWRTLDTAVIGTRGTAYGPDDFTNFQYPSASSVTAGQAGSDMYAFDVGIDAEYGYYNNAGSTARAFELIEYSVCVTRAIYMRDALLRPYLGRVIIRTDETQDPYYGMGGGTYLGELRTHWNNNHSAANSDLVAGVCPGKVGGGLAWVGVVGGTSKYSVNDAGSDGFFDVIWRHEMGHNWSCSHFVGGSPEGAGLMGGNQPGRMSGCEVYKVLSHRDAKISAGGILDNESAYTAVELPPYASMDVATFQQTVDSSVSISVLANDHDANGQALNIDSYDSTSANGGTVTQSGSNLVYSAPGSYLGTDYFQYVVEDSAGHTATGVVIIDVQSTDDLKLYVNLDETTGTTADDASVYGNTVTLSGTDFTTSTVTGKYGSALTFDGSDDYLLVSGVSLNSNTVTMTAWIKPNGTQTSYSGIIFDRSSGAQGFNFGTNGELRYHWNSTNWGWNSGLTPTPGSWTFVALVIEPTKATIYMNDGSGFQSAVRTAAHTAASLGTTYIGRDPNSAARSFYGEIDDARIYSKSMTQAELQGVYDGGTAEAPSPFEGAYDVSSDLASWAPSAAATSYEIYLGTSQTAVSNATTASAEYQGGTTETEWILDIQASTSYFWRVDTVTASGTVTGAVWNFSTASQVYEAGLVAYWEFSEGSGTNVADSSQNSNTGTVSGTTWGAGYAGNGLEFDSSDYIDFGNGPSLGGKTDFTVSAWIKTTGTNDQVIIQQRASNGYNGQYGFRVLSSGVVNFYVYGNGANQYNFSTTTTVNDGEWHFVAAVRDGTEGYIYIDGNPVAVASATGTIRDLNSGIDTAVGRDVRNNNSSFNGTIDEVKVYSRAKSGQELAAQYNSMPFPDSDSDGLDDDWEIANFGSTSVQSGSDDNDGDGLSNGNEYIAGTDPSSGDSDGDGYSDGFEFNQGTDPDDALDAPTTLLVYLWEFNSTDFNGGTTVDTVGGVDADFVGGAALTADGGGFSGQGGDKALDLGNNGDGKYTEATSMAALQLASQNDEITISYWQKLDQTGVYMSTFWAYSPASGGDYRGLQAHTPWSNNNIYFDMGSAASSRRISCPTPSGTTWTQWNHIALVKDGGTAKIYVNGVLADTETGKSSLYTDYTKLIIGATGTGGNSVDGLIDDFAIFSSALTGTQISLLAAGADPVSIQ